MSNTGWTPVEDTSAWTPVEESAAQQAAPSSSQFVPNARIRNLPNPAEGMSPGRAAYEGAKTGLFAGSLGAAGASPASAARALVGGTAGSLVGSTAAGISGAGELGQEVSGDVGSLIGGGLAEGTYNFAKGIIANKLLTPEGELTALGKAVAHPVEKGGEYALRRVFGVDQDVQEAHNVFAKNLAQLEKQRQQELSQMGRLKTMDEIQQAKLAKEQAKADLFEQAKQEFIAKKAAGMPKPLNPLVATPEEFAAYQQQMRVLQQQASDAGMYHAAQGSVNKRTTLQQRMGKKFTE